MKGILGKTESEQLEKDELGSAFVFTIGVTRLLE